MGTRLQPHTAGSRELALPVLGAARGRPGGGACCVGVGCPNLGRSPTPDRLSLGRAAGARYPLAVGEGMLGAGTQHQPHSVRSWELALRAVGVAGGRPKGVAPLAWTQQHSTTEHRQRGAGHPRKTYQPQGSRPRGQTGEPTPKHATRRQPRTARPSAAPQHTTGNSTTHSIVPHHREPESAQTTGTAQSKRTSTVQPSTGQSGVDRERTAGHPRTTTAPSTAANRSTHHHTTATDTNHRIHSAGKYHKTQRRKAQDPRATDSVRGHDTASSGTKRATQNSAAHNSTTQGGATRGSTAPRDTAHHSTRQSTAKPDSKTPTRTTQPDDTTKDAAQQAAATQGAAQRAPHRAEQPATKQGGTPHQDKQHVIRRTATQNTRHKRSTAR